MIITNNKSLPAPIYTAIIDHKHRGGDLSASQMSKSIRQIILEKRYCDSIEIDASDCLTALFGMAFHAYIAEYAPPGTIAERYMETMIKGRILSGTMDLYHDGKITDWKTTSVWSIIYKSSIDSWTKQLNTYAYLVRKVERKEVHSLEVVAYLTDWHESKIKDDYPNSRLITAPINLWPYQEQESFLVNKVDDLIRYSDTPDVDLPDCTPDDRWYTGTTWAVKRRGRKSALRLFSTEDEAVQYSKLNPGTHIEVRLGQNKKCDKYCIAKSFCNQYQKLQQEYNHES